ncbi:MAG: hypothetical protein JWM17_2966, partial [Actinobacteria bacterium]|nr:hypothetical protein [Actinomycetota bacterium]
MASRAEVTCLPPAAGASGAGVSEGDLPAMSQARHRLQRERHPPPWFPPTGSSG